MNRIARLAALLLTIASVASAQVSTKANANLEKLKFDASGNLIAVVAGGSATPTGPAGGDLSGTYPNPSVAKVTSGTTVVTNGVDQDVCFVDGTVENCQDNGIKWSKTPNQLIIEDQDVTASTQIIVRNHGQGAGILAEDAAGTIASPTALQLGDSVGAYLGGGYDGTSWSHSQTPMYAWGIGGSATQNWTATHHGTNIGIYVTPNDSTTAVVTSYFDQDGSFHLGYPSTRLGSEVFHGNTSGAVTIKPAAAAGTWSLTLPTDDGTPNQFLQTNGSGVTTWATSSGGITGTGTTGLIPDWTGASALGDSAAYRISVTNDTVTGTTNNKLAKFTSAGKAIITAAAETSGVLGIIHSGAATSGSAVVTTLGAESCVSDNATTAGHYATVSASVAGDCSDTGSATFPVAGTQVIGIWTETGVAGTRTMFFNTPDVASASSGGGGGGAKNPGGAAGDVQYRAAGNNFAAEAALNYSASTDNLVLANATTSASSALNLGSTTLPTGALAYTGTSTAASSGNNYAGVFSVSAATGSNIAVFGKSNGTAAGTNVAGLFNASGSTEGTGSKNIAVLGTLSTTDPSSATYGNITYAGFFDGGTLPTTKGGTLKAIGTLNSAATTGDAPSGYQAGVVFSITGAGNSASNFPAAVVADLAAGYTGVSDTAGLKVGNESAGTAGNLNLGSSSNASANFSAVSIASASTSGYEIGVYGAGENSSVENIGVMGRANQIVAGTNIGVLGNAAQSTEGTNLKNIAGWFTLTTTDPAAVADNVSVTLAAASDGTADIFRGYSTTTKNYSISAGGNTSQAGTMVSTRSTDLGWTVQNASNQACNTTCTTGACVVGIDTLGAGGFLACTDATADSCVCAG